MDVFVRRMIYFCFFISLKVVDNRSDISSSLEEPKKEKIKFRMELINFHNGIKDSKNSDGFDFGYRRILSGFSES